MFNPNKAPGNPNRLRRALLTLAALGATAAVLAGCENPAESSSASITAEAPSPTPDATDAAAFPSETVGSISPTSTPQAPEASVSPEQMAFTAEQQAYLDSLGLQDETAGGKASLTTQEALIKLNELGITPDRRSVYTEQTLPDGTVAEVIANGDEGARFGGNIAVAVLYMPDGAVKLVAQPTITTSTGSLERPITVGDIKDIASYIPDGVDQAGNSYPPGTIFKTVVGTNRDIIADVAIIPEGTDYTLQRAS